MRFILSLIARAWLLLVAAFFVLAGCATAPPPADPAPPKQAKAAPPANPQTADEWLRHVVTTARFVHEGPCADESLGMKAPVCIVLVDEANQVGWFLLFGDAVDARRDPPRPSAVVRVTPGAAPKVVFCKPAYCPRGAV